MWAFDELTFAIDEPPVALAERKAAVTDWEAGDDLLTQISTLLAENERLTLTAKLLEEAQGDTDEMRNLARRLLPVLDGFERTLAMGRDFPDDPTLANWLRSVENIYYRLKNLLEKVGLFGMEDVGKPVNLDLHEVVEYRYSPDHKPDTVIVIRQRGYAFRGHLLREAQVVVASNERSQEHHGENLGH